MSAIGGPAGTLLPQTLPASQAPAADGRPFAAAAYVLLRSRRLVFGCLLAGAVAGLGFGLMLPNSYTSSGMLFLRSGARESETAESAVAGGTFASPRGIDIMGTEIEILSHPDVLRRVVQMVGADRVLEPYDPSADDSPATPAITRWLHGVQRWWFAANMPATGEMAGRQEQLALRLLRDIQLTPVGGTMLRVSYAAHDPELARDVVNAMLSASVERHRQAFAKTTSVEFLSRVEDEARKAARAVNDSLQEFKATHKIYDLDAERVALLAESLKLEGQIAADDETLREHQNRTELLEGKLKDEPPLQELMTESAPVANPEHAYLSQQLFTLRLQKQTLETSTPDLQELKRRVEALDRLIGSLEERLQNTPRVTVPPQTRQTVRNPRYDWLRGELDKVQIALGTLRETTRQRKDQVTSVRQRLDTLERLRHQYEWLRAEAARHESQSNRFLESRRNLELLNLLDEHKISNLTVLEGANVPLEKTGPNRLRLLGAGVFLGFVLGAALAFLRDRFDGCLRRARDVEQLGAATVSVVPELPRSLTRRLDHGGITNGSLDEAAQRGLDAIWQQLNPERLSSGRTVLAITGEAGTGVTTMALGIAACLARNLRLQVLLVEADLRRPAVAGRLVIPAGPGLAELAAGTADRSAVVRPTAVPGLSVVTAGSSDATQLQALTGGAVADLLPTLADGFQAVVLDVPSVIVQPELLPLLLRADVVIPVFAAGNSSKQTARRLVGAIASTGKRPAGAILNRWRSVRPFWLPKTLPV
jgi:uncharacterized protein involved in exopolysaccharide biosynthesis/Mrp family chromosome partitioning ATPase